MVSASPQETRLIELWGSPLRGRRSVVVVVAHVKELVALISAPVNEAAVKVLRCEGVIRGVVANSRLTSTLGLDCPVCNAIVTRCLG